MNGLDELYPVRKYRETLETCCARNAIQVCHGKELIEIRPDLNQAVFAEADGDGQLSCSTEDFDLLHVSPRQVPIEPLRYSALSDLQGFVEVDKYTLQSV